MKQPNVSRMRQFDPGRVARLETQLWVAYYNKRWLNLLQLLVSMAKDAFGLSTLQAIIASYFATRAQMAFAPVPANDVPRAIDYQQRFYRHIKRVHAREPFDPDAAGKLDVEWWVIHRALFAQKENKPLVAAIAALYAETYRVPRDHVWQAAFYRAEAMQYSDRWVREGHPASSPLLRQEQAELMKAYSALRAAVNP